MCCRSRQDVQSYGRWQKKNWVTIFLFIFLLFNPKEKAKLQRMKNGNCVASSPNSLLKIISGFFFIHSWFCTWTLCCTPFRFDCFIVVIWFVMFFVLLAAGGTAVEEPLRALVGATLPRLSPASPPTAPRPRVNAAITVFVFFSFFFFYFVFPFVAHVLPKHSTLLFITAYIQAAHAGSRLDAGHAGK